MKSKSKISQLLLSTLVITGVSVASTQLSSCKSDDNIDNNFPELTAMVQEKINQVIDEEEYATTCYGFPSAQICVTQNDKVIYNKAFGKALRYSQGDNNLNGLGTELPEDQQVVATTSTMYDLASNTKMYSVMMAIQHLLYTGEIGSVNDTIQKYIPEFSGQRSVNQQSFYLQNLTLKNILTHTSGFKASPTEFLTDQDAQNEPNLLQVRDKSQIIPNVMLLPFDSYPGTRQMYSDIDFVMAGLVIERVTGVSLDTYVENYIYKPLGLRRTMYTPLKKGFTKNYCAATELVGNTREHYVDPVGSWSDDDSPSIPISYRDIRTNTIHGEVHDEVSYYCLQGVSGHAGLFSTAEDISVLQRLMLNNGTYRGVTLFNKAIVDEVTTPIQSPSSSAYNFAIGWKTNHDSTGDFETSDWGNSYLFGNQAPTTVYGHDGWTGTSTLIDPTHNITISVLTNAIHSPLRYGNRPFWHNTFIGKSNYFLPPGEPSGNWSGCVIFDAIYTELANNHYTSK